MPGVGYCMAIKLSNMEGGNLLEVQVTGRLVHEDYEQFVPEFERLLSEHGKLRLLFEMVDFHGWSVCALWDDIKFDVKHFSDIEQMAMVGDEKWEKGMSVFCKPFTRAKIQYFDRSAIGEARKWLEGVSVDSM